jgi:hypothetical protein
MVRMSAAVCVVVVSVVRMSAAVSLVVPWLCGCLRPFTWSFRWLGGFLRPLAWSGARAKTNLTREENMFDISISTERVLRANNQMFFKSNRFTNTCLGLLVLVLVGSCTRHDPANIKHTFTIYKDWVQS